VEPRLPGVIKVLLCGLDINRDNIALVLVQPDLVQDEHGVSKVVFTVRFADRIPTTTVHAGVDRALKILKEVAAKTRLFLVGVDSSSLGIYIAENLKQALHPLGVWTRLFEITASGEPSWRKGVYRVSRLDLLMHASGLIHERRVIIPTDCLGLINELNGLEVQITRARNVTVVPVGGEDDLTMALSLALWLSRELPPDTIALGPQGPRLREPI